MDKAGRDNRSNQCNPNNDRYQNHVSSYNGPKDNAAIDNRSNQMNPNNAAYHGTHASSSNHSSGSHYSGKHGHHK